MRKSFNTTLIFMGILIVLMAWYLAYEKKMKPQAKEAEEKSKQFVTLDKDQIQEIVIERMTNAPAEGVTPTANFFPTYEKTDLKKTGQDWQIVSPLQDGTDSATLSGMVSAITTTKQDRLVEEKPKDLEPFGLKNPLIKIRIKKEASGKVEEILIGANTPIGFNSYVKTSASDSVYRAPRSLRTAFDKPLKDLRNKALFSIARADITEAEIQTPKESLILKKEDNKDEWTLAREGIPADVNEWNKTLNVVIDSKATDFPEVDTKASGKALVPFGLSPARTHVTLTRKDKSKFTLLLGQANGKSYAKREDKETIFEVDKDVIEKAERPASSYRNLQLSQFNRYDVDRIKLQNNRGALELVKEGGNWKLPADDKAKIDNTKVDTLLTKLQDIKIDKYLTEKSLKVTETTQSLMVRLFEKSTSSPSAKNPADKSLEKEKVILKFGKPKTGQVLAARNDLPLPFVIKEEDFKTLNLSKQDFIQKEQKPVEQKAEEKKPAEKKS